MKLLLAMIVIMPFEMSPHLYLAPSFLGLIQDVTVIKLLGILGSVWALLKIVTGSGGEPIFGSQQARLFAALFVGILISATLNGSAFLAIAKSVALVLFMPFVLVSVQTQDDLRRVVQTIVVTMTLVVPYAFWQQTIWNGRLGVGLYETNYFAANLVLTAPLAFAIASGQPSRAKRLLWIGSGLVLVLAVLKTASRGGYLGLLAAALVYTYRRYGVGGALGALVLLILAALPMDLGERAVATIASDAAAPPGLDESTQAHTALFWGGVRMMMDAPIFGVGPQRFGDYSRLYSGLDTPYIAHNTFLELAAEAGLPVLMLFLLLLATAIGALARAAKLTAATETRALATWAEGLGTGLIGFAVASAFISAQYEKPFWLVIFLSIVIGRLAARRAQTTAEGLGLPLATRGSARRRGPRRGPRAP